MWHWYMISSPRSTRANESLNWAFPSRSDFTSLPWRTMPHSSLDSMWYSCHARRFSMRGERFFFWSLATASILQRLAQDFPQGVVGQLDRVVAHAAGALGEVDHRRNVGFGHSEVRERGEVQVVDDFVDERRADPQRDLVVV